MSPSLGNLVAYCVRRITEPIAEICCVSCALHKMIVLMVWLFLSGCTVALKNGNLMLDAFHKGVFNKKWTCCGGLSRDCSGCIATNKYGDMESSKSKRIVQAEDVHRHAVRDRHRQLVQSVIVPGESPSNHVDADNRLSLDVTRILVSEQQVVADSEQVTDEKQVITDGEQVIADGKQVVADGEHVTDGEQVTDGKQVVTDGEQDVTDGKQVVTNGEQVITDDGKLVTGEENVNRLSGSTGYKHLACPRSVWVDVFGVCWGE